MNLGRAVKTLIELYDTFLITASTNELQQFILKYGKDDRFFSKENSVTLIRKS